MAILVFSRSLTALGGSPPASWSQPQPWEGGPVGTEAEAEARGPRAAREQAKGPLKVHTSVTCPSLPAARSSETGWSSSSEHPPRGTVLKASEL